jgi:hypothetical protein
MKSADEEIAIRVASKLQRDDRWSRDFINKIALYLKEGKVSSSDIIFLIENQNVDDNGVKDEDTKDITC